MIIFLNETPQAMVRQGLDEAAADSQLGFRDHVDLTLVPARVLKSAIAQCKQRVIAATSHILTGMEVRSPLTNDDVARLHLLACEHLAAKALCM